MEPLGTLRTMVLRVADVEAACRFYSDTLGLAARFRNGDRWAEFDAGGIRVALAGGPEPPEPVTLSIKVADVNAAAQRAVAGAPPRCARLKRRLNQAVGNAPSTASKAASVMWSASMPV